VIGVKQAFLQTLIPTQSRLCTLSVCTSTAAISNQMVCHAQAVLVVLLWAFRVDDVQRCSSGAYTANGKGPLTTHHASASISVLRAFRGAVRSTVTTQALEKVACPEDHHLADAYWCCRAPAMGMPRFYTAPVVQLCTERAPAQASHLLSFPPHRCPTHLTLCILAL
jgi:hypothetical protein